MGQKILTGKEVYYLLIQKGVFILSLQFTEEYPNKAPTVKFLSKMFHPNSIIMTYNKSTMMAQFVLIFFKINGVASMI